MVDSAFIMAASHSGSTLLAMLLGSHPQATTIGDTAGTQYRKNPDYLCSCGAKASSCPFWQNVIRQMARRGFDLDTADFRTRFEYPQRPCVNRVLQAEHRGPVLETARDVILSLSPGWKRRFEQIARQNVALVETITEMTGAKILVDSSKQPHRLKFLLRIPGLRMRIIHLIRDGRGVSHTYIHDNHWPAEKSALEWRRSIMAARRLLSQLPPDAWIQVRYEDLCANPVAELGKLYAYLGLDPLSVSPDLSHNGLHVFGNKMRLSSDKTMHIDDKWQTELTGADRSTIENLAGRQLRMYGYA